MPRQPRKTSLGNILDTPEETSNNSAAKAPGFAPDTVVPTHTATAPVFVAHVPSEAASSPSISSSPSTSDQHRPVLFRSVREALESGSNVVEDPGGYIVTRRRGSVGSQSATAEPDEAGYTVIRRASCDDVSELRGAATTRQRQPKRSQQQQHHHHWQRHSDKKEHAHHTSHRGKQQQQQHSSPPQQQPWQHHASSNKHAAAETSAATITTTRARMEQLTLLATQDPNGTASSSWRATAPVGSLATSTSSNLWPPPSQHKMHATQRAGSNEDEDEEQQEPIETAADDPHVVWGNASMWAEAPTEPPASSAAAPAIAGDAIMSSWLMWEDPLAKASDHDEL